MTPDLLRLRENQGALMPVLERLELELVDDPAWGEPSDTSYLSPAERANPDIAANVAAMAATNKLVAWFGRDQEGFVGLWRGTDGAHPLDASPVVRLDTEGQYAIVAATIPDYVAVSVPEDEFASTRDALMRAGFTSATTSMRSGTRSTATTIRTRIATTCTRRSARIAGSPGSRKRSRSRSPRRRPRRPTRR